MKTGRVRITQWGIAVGILILLMLGALTFLPDRLRIVSGYAAKCMCSGVFVAGRSPDSIRARDLNFSFIKYARTWVDPEERAAYASLFGMARRRAVYREDLGCTLETKGVPVSAGQANGFSLPPPSAEPDAPWPLGGQVADTLLPEVDYPRLERVLEGYFDGPGQRMHNTHAALVVCRGQIVAERYAPGFDAQTPQLGWSMAKTITAALIGRLIDEGKLELDQPAPVAAWANDERRRITLRQLLNMDSGLEWQEEYGDVSDATRMLYLHRDKAAFAIDKPLRHAPGTVWEYASGTTNILQHIIRQQFASDEAYWRFPYEQLLYPAGMRRTRLEVDATGLIVGSSYAYATARDWARMGLLYLNGGTLAGRRVLSEAWTDFSRTPTESSGGEYAGQLWHNHGGHYPSNPRDMYYLRGFHGQRVFVVPSHELVVVRLGVSELDTFDFDAFLADILGCVAIPPG